MKLPRRAAVIWTVLLLLGALTTPARAELRAATLKGYEEVPAISTKGNGLFAMYISDQGDALAYSLVYSDLEGGSVTAAHIHIGQPNVSGGIMIHFCGTGGKPACPAAPGTVTGTATATDIVAVTAQGIAPGEIEEAIRAIREGRAYVNVHTAAFPGGEIRGQIH